MAHLNDDGLSEADRRERYRELRRELRNQKLELKTEQLRMRNEKRALRVNRKAPFSAERLLESLKNRFFRLSTSVRVHGFVFLSTFALLFAINLFAPGLFVPWSVMVAMSWGIGMGAHLQALLNRRRDVKQLSKAQDAPDEAARNLRRYQKSVGAWNQHRTAFLLTNALVWFINIWSMLLGPYSVPWAAFLTGAWGIGLGCHWMGHIGRRRMLADKLASDGFPVADLRGGRIGAPARAYSDATLFGKAQGIRDELLAKYRENDKLQAHWSDVEPLLNTLTEQIGELEKKRTEFDALMKTFSVADLEDELEKVRRKEQVTTDDFLKQEYRRSITQYESHLKAASGLAHHRELLDLRLSSAFHLVKQLEIDTVRLLSVDSFAEPSSLAALRAKTEETQLFLEDFKKGMNELEGEF
ncbi:MAG: 2TM domain-containing protein [Spirochaetales bacterium]|nr:2TM domain-containing protein [Spirochaetales bacterium]